jgi:hypothetical protein
MKVALVAARVGKTPMQPGNPAQLDFTLLQVLARRTQVFLENLR